MNSTRLFCQFEAALFSDIGDSGGPIFQEDSKYPIPDLDGEPVQTVKLVGILWGGPTLCDDCEPDDDPRYYGTTRDGDDDENEHITWFSPWVGVKSDLESGGSTLDVCHPMGNPNC